MTPTVIDLDEARAGARGVLRDYGSASVEDVELGLLKLDPNMARASFLAVVSSLRGLEEKDGLDLWDAFAQWARSRRPEPDLDIWRVWEGTEPGEGAEFFKTVKDAKPVLTQEARTVGPAPRDLTNGSDVDLAKCVKRGIESNDGPIVYAEGCLHHYVDGHWAPYSKAQLVRWSHVLDNLNYPLAQGKTGTVRLNEGKIRSILLQLEAMADMPEFFAARTTGINCANGFIQFNTWGEPTLLPHSRRHRARHTLPGSWEGEADWRRAPLLAALLEGCFMNDDDKAARIDLIGEIFGCAALGHGTRLINPRAFFLHGPGANNGKNQIIDCARSLLPPEAISSTEPSAFSDPAMLTGLAGKLLNTTGDLASTRAIESGVFKGAITGDAMTAKRLYKGTFEFRPEALHLAATNGLPPFHGGFDMGLARRLVVLPFNRVIPAGERVRDLAARIAAEEGDALLSFAVEGASRLIRQTRYTEPPSCLKALDQWMVSTDPVRAWMAERMVFDADAETTVQDAYFDFERWAYGDRNNRTRRVERSTFATRVYSYDSRIRSRATKLQRIMTGLRLLEHIGQVGANAPDLEPSQQRQSVICLGSASRSDAETVTG